MDLAKVVLAVVAASLAVAVCGCQSQVDTRAGASAAMTGPTGPAPAVPKTHRELAREYESIRDYPAAIREYRLAINETPDDSRLYVNLGLLYEQQQQYGRAEHYWQRAVSINPGDHRAWNLLGNAAKRQGQYNDAIEYYKKAIATEPSFAEAHWNLAVCYRNIGMTPLASDHYRRYMALASPKEAGERKAAEAFLMATGDE